MFIAKKLVDYLIVENTKNRLCLPWSGLLKNCLIKIPKYVKFVNCKYIYYWSLNNSKETYSQQGYNGFKGCAEVV